MTWQLQIQFTQPAQQPSYLQANTDSKIVMAATPATYSLYPYDPVKALPVIFAVFILIIAVVQIYQSAFKYGWRRFYGSTTIASTAWCAGFICREVSIFNPQALGPYIAQYVLLFAGPPLYAGSEYFVLGRILAYVPYHSPIHPGRVLTTFVILETLVEVLSANGAATVATSQDLDTRNSGLLRVEIALILQACLEVAFFFCVFFIQRRCKRAKHFPKNLRTISAVLYVTSAMMLVRCIYRVIEMFEANGCTYYDPGCAFVDQHEWPFWVFEVANITVYIAILTIFPPGKYLPPNDKIYLDPVDGQTERVGPGWANADKRSLWLTMADPFDFKGRMSGKGKAIDKFWERDQPVHKASNRQAEAEDTSKNMP